MLRCSLTEIKKEMETHSRVDVIFKTIMSKEKKHDFAKKYDATIVRIDPDSMNSMVMIIPKDKLGALKKDSDIKNVLVYW